MYNALLDRLPEDYDGWLIRTDYRIGIQIQQCVSDPALTEYERTATALTLLYGNGIPSDIRKAIKGLTWFMSGGNPSTEADGADDAPPVFSFEIDSARIASAFRRVFHIDITRERMHWFEFLAMLSDLDGTAFSSVIDIRQRSASEVDAKRRAEFLRMQKRYALPKTYTDEEEQHIESILAEVRQAEQNQSGAESG